jgi:hypothetical protein
MQYDQTSQIQSSTPIQVLNFLQGEQEVIETAFFGGQVARTKGRKLPDTIIFSVPFDFPLETNNKHFIVSHSKLELPHHIEITNIEFTLTLYGMQKVVTAYVMG